MNINSTAHFFKTYNTVFGSVFIGKHFIRRRIYNGIRTAYHVIRMHRSAVGIKDIGADIRDLRVIDPV